jgi:hypothetical protein
MDVDGNLMNIRDRRPLLHSVGNVFHTALD